METFLFLMGKDLRYLNLYNIFFVLSIGMMLNAWDAKFFYNTQGKY